MSESATEALRRMLDERGVEFATDDFDHLLTTSWHINDVFAQYLESIGDYVDEDDPTLKLKMKHVTPEQAIAATLGGGECETCHGESDLSEWVCSECQCWIPLGLTPENIGRASEWRYCPHCGRKAVKL